MNHTNNTGGLDRFRLVGALLVVAIHTSPLTFLSAEADFFLTRILARVAVPFFLMVTGQFVLPRILQPGPRARRRLVRYLARIGVLYLVCILLYLPLGIYAGHYKELNMTKILQLLIWDGTFYHLWYFPACMLGAYMGEAADSRLPSAPVLATGLILSLLGMTGEAFGLRHLESLRHDSMYLLLAPVMFCLYGLLLHCSCPACPGLRRMSTLVYILHPAVIIAVRVCARLPHMLPLMEHSLIHYLAVCTASLAAAWLLTGLTDYHRQRKTDTSKTAGTY